jgi:hypothetical protein
MGISNSMRELTQDILSSTEERAKELTKIKEGTNILRQDAVDMVKDFSISRGETSRQLSQELSQSVADRKQVVMQSLENAQSMIQDFHDSRRKSGEQLCKELAQGNKLLVQNEKKRKQEVGEMLDAFQNSREETGVELRKDLANGKAKIKLEVKEALTNARDMVNGYQSSRQTMGAELKNDLVKDRDERKANVEDMRNDFRKAQAEVQADLKGASNIWKEMGSPTLKKSFGGKQSPNISMKTSLNLKEQLLSIVNQHAKGITLSKVAKELGVVTIVLGKAAKVLLEEGKVRKKAKIYFPANI